MFPDRFHRTLIGRGLPLIDANRISDIVHKAYSRPSRHYHTMAHLDNLHAQLLPVWNRLEDADAVVFAIAFHDLVYSNRVKNNERRSAERATELLGQAGIDPRTIQRCANHILATATHSLSDDPDTNFFTDADLSILGAAPQAYRRYAEQVRKEYGIYPDFLYIPGRRKVLAHFLTMPCIFKTEHFQQRYEAQARINLRDELDRLA